MVINSTETTISIANLTNVIQQRNISKGVSTPAKENKIIQFPNVQLLEKEVEKANIAAAMNDKVSADYTSQRYLHLLLVAGSYALARTRRIAVNS